MRTRPVPTPAGFPALALISTALLVAMGCGGKISKSPVIQPSPPLAGQPPRTDDSREKAGVYHILEKGQTLYALHRAYQVPVSALMEANGIEDVCDIPAGTPIFIPGATKLITIPSPRRAILTWPLTGRVTSRFGRRGKRGRHDGIDIDGAQGETVRAAAAGTVIQAGRDGQYGKSVLMDHGGGLRTRYAHASKLLVKRGDRVKQGDPIAEVGKTGNATGTHLHFEALRHGRPMDPLPLLQGQRESRAAAR